MIGRKRRFQEVSTFGLSNPEREVDLLSIPKPESPLIIEAFQVEVLGTLECQRRGLCLPDPVDRQQALVVIPIVAAHEVQAWPLLRETQRHDLDRPFIARGILVVQLKPEVLVQRFADHREDSWIDLRREQWL